MTKSASGKSLRPMRVVKLLYDDGQCMRVGTPLDMNGDVLLMDSDQEIEVGTALRLVPIVDDECRTDIFEFEAEVVKTYVDVLVSAYADNRFILTLRVPDRGDLLRNVEALVAEARATRRSPRRRRNPHVSGLVASGFWAEQTA
ncbi:MAG: hypothetical protein QF464_01890 [Myxococcota bacterium]|nr:hypothetical protein [Myxococcota bacterium]